MQSTDGLSPSSATGAGGGSPTAGSGYHRVRTQSEGLGIAGTQQGEGRTHDIPHDETVIVTHHDDDDDDLELHMTPSKGDGYHQVSHDEHPPHRHLHSPPSTQALGSMHNRSRSWEMDDEGGGHLFDDEDDEEEDAQVIRRYAYRNRIPIVPAEFSHQPFPRRLWQSFVELRTSARQRRAARLLNNSQYTQTTHCILTWCCDATDRGIALVAILILLWLVIGWVNNGVFRGYWLLGMILFAIRVSARTTYESLMTRKRGGGGFGFRAGGSANSISMSQQQQPPPPAAATTTTQQPSTAPSTSPTSLEMKNDYRDNA